ncbi:hypothetical protein SUDANB106_02353 [Streptomyces sp. enrichment culture]|uniref:hypothetical protein n=1 Tax=Streptomyces sp. enrichment culture TaxID=1795815 RepID=UPI002189A806|nr:hypothetical protein LUW77_13185 [Streptomyces radiopugnans]
MLTAYIDESMRRRRGEASCVYVLAAVLVPDDAESTVRATMEGLRHGRSRVVHWRKERPERRTLIASAIAGLPVTGLVAVCLHDAEVRSERARRRCLLRLLDELARRDVERVIFETRHEQDAADRAVVTSLRKAKVVTDAMSLTWEDPGAWFAGLWVADCVAGAVSWWLDGHGTHWSLLEGQVTLVDVEAD